MNEENSKWLVVVNPKASIGKGDKDWQGAVFFCGQNRCLGLIGIAHGFHEN